jgi:hypothetical protein
VESYGYGSGWSVSLLSQNQICFAGPGVVALVDAFAMQQHDDVGILL